MSDQGRRPCAVTIDLGGATAMFGCAQDAPVGASAAELALLAGSHLAVALGRAIPVLYAEQKHTKITYVYSSLDRLPAGPHLVGACDGLLTATPEVALSVRTADCLPVALAGDGVVAMIHAGWRGLAQDILGACLGRLRAEFGVPPDELEAAIGVGIGPCHYEVGEEVLAALSAWPVAEPDWRQGRWLDLAGWARGRLLALGFQASRVRVLPGCTACSPSFHSHRRDGVAAGRQWSVVVREGLRHGA
jgi:YfiH family protein